MAMTVRRAFLGLTLLSLVGEARSEDRRKPPGLTDAERNSIRWGDAKNGIEAGLRLILPKVAVRSGDKVELGAYLRNRTDSPITLIYYPALWEQTATVFGPDGKQHLVEGTFLTGIPTSVRVTLAPRETVVVDHPGFWIGKTALADPKRPYLEDPTPGVYRVSQKFGITSKSEGRKALSIRGQVSTTALIVFSAARIPRRIQAEVVVSAQEELDPSMTSGELSITIAAS